jgi:circadian clock protein KaiC
VLTGSARLARETLDNALVLARKQEIERIQRELERKRTLLEVQLVTLKAQFEAEEKELQQAIHKAVSRTKTLDQDRRQMARLRGADEA